MQSPRNVLKITPIALAIYMNNSLLCTKRVLEKHEKGSNACGHLFNFNELCKNRDKMFVACSH